MTQISTPIWQLKAFQQWIHTVLLKELLPPRGSVLLMDGAEHAGKAIRQGAGTVVCVCGSDSERAAAMENWKHRMKQQKAPLPGESMPDVQFVACGTEQVGERLALCVNQWAPFDVVVWSDTFDAHWRSSAEADAAVGAVSSLLSPRGQLCGVIPDAARLWCIGQKAIFRGEMGDVLKRKLHNLQFKQGWEECDYDTCVDIFYGDGSAERRRMVRSADYIEVLRRHGLRLIAMPNLIDAFNQLSFNHAVSLAKIGLLHGHNPAHIKIFGGNALTQMELIELYCCHIVGRRRTEKGHDGFVDGDAAYDPFSET